MNRLFATSLLLLSACWCRTPSPSSMPVAPEAQAVFHNPAAPVEARVEALLSQMSLADKVRQMHGLEMKDEGGMSSGVDDARLGIPRFRMIDGPRGVGSNAGTSTSFPVGLARGATFDPDLELRVGRAMGAEARAKGANVLLAPTLNLLRHPRWGRAQETYGEDPHHVGAMGAAFVRGAQEHLVACPKHFALNSIEDTRLEVDVVADEAVLRDVYLPHFRDAVRAGAGAFMSAYNRVNGDFCSESRHLLTDVLRSDWGFEGIVVSDWVFGTHDTVRAANAGLDVEMPWPKAYGTALVSAVREGRVPEQAVDDAVRRILRTKLRFGLYDGRPPLDPDRIVESPEHLALAREAAEKSLVLLTNPRRLLPLRRSGSQRIAVVGALAAVANLGDVGSSHTVSTKVTTLLESLTALAGPSPVLDLSHDFLSTEDLSEVASAQVAVVVVGLTSADEGEALIGAGDRRSLSLSPEHEALIASVVEHNPNTVVVLEAGSAVRVEPFVDRVAALLLAWYPGSQGGKAIARVLLGEVNPSGRLPVTFPRDEAQLPPFENDRLRVTYDPFHGYRYFDQTGAQPRFPFGFGLGYTTFALSNLSLSTATLAPDGRLAATVDVTNTGAVRGTQVVQLYVSPPPPGGRGLSARALRAFARVELAPGESRTVRLSVDAAALARWDRAAGRPVVEPGTHEVQVGTSSRDLPLRAHFEVGPSGPGRTTVDGR
ncbi:MAG: glycoside hydrolase family 3 N-terminal domain-containing protein [Myxococcales bacterium]